MAERTDRDVATTQATCTFSQGFSVDSFLLFYGLGAAAGAEDDSHTSYDTKNQNPGYLEPR